MPNNTQPTSEQPIDPSLGGADRPTDPMEAYTWDQVYGVDEAAEILAQQLYGSEVPLDHRIASRGESATQAETGEIEVSPTVAAKGLFSRFRLGRKK